MTEARPGSRRLESESRRLDLEASHLRSCWRPSARHNPTDHSPRSDRDKKRPLTASQISLRGDSDRPLTAATQTQVPSIREAHVLLGGQRARTCPRAYRSSRLRHASFDNLSSECDWVTRHHLAGIWVARSARATGVRSHAARGVTRVNARSTHGLQRSSRTTRKTSTCGIAADRLCAHPMLSEARWSLGRRAADVSLLHSDEAQSSFTRCVGHIRRHD